MDFSLDSYFGIAEKALAAQEKRASILANNLANTDTPNYKAKDLDFNEYLAASMAAGAQQVKQTARVIWQLEPILILVLYLKSGLQLIFPLMETR